MIQRYNSWNKRITPRINLNRKFLAFCNWSFVKEKHLKEEEALKLFDSFEIEKNPFYIRIFNEMPRAVLDDFISRNNISKEKVLNIYNNLLLNTSFRINTYE